MAMHALPGGAAGSIIRCEYSHLAPDKTNKKPVKNTTSVKQTTGD